MTKKKENRFVEGISLILLGLFFLAIQKGLFRWNQIWQFALIIPGLAFFISYLKDRKNYSVLMPGTILTTLGIYFLFMEEYGWYHMEEFWPIFILAPGVGFFMMFFASGMKKDFWIPGTILVMIAGIFFVEAWNFLEYWPIIIILVGVYLVYAGFKKREKDDENY